MSKSVEKIVVLLISFVVFIAGVWALYEGDDRRYMLWSCIAILLVIALRQTLKKIKR